ncbi:hypothetical protein FHETE_6389 [Fusarium heterosporum]|uniref:Peptidase A1 domain-containing protein n=1 Tax=Fusarium heterosporum TaxID=42747 RepID=A0A8H5TAJ2_FUSHE|nr:hypothetical protein FHETE_6389 [Fusarium heterosporum]
MRTSTSAAMAAALIGTASAAVIDLPISIRDGYAMVDFGVGTPAQHFNLLFDTGSTSTWIVDEECAETCAHVDKGHRTGYNKTASSTGSYTGEDASIDYLGGRVAGPTVKEQFAADGVKFEASFIAANESNWSSLAAAGFMGLAFGSIADGGAQPLFETLMEEKKVDEPKFGIYYSRADGDDTNGAPGKGLLTLGGSKEKEYVDGELTTFKITTGGQDFDVWRSILHTVTGSCKKSNCTKKAETKVDMLGAAAVFDTGASGITFSTDKIDEIYESIGWNWQDILHGKHVPLCSEFTDDWSITLSVGYYGEEVDIVITGDQLALPGFANRDDACWPPFDDSGAYGFGLIGKRALKNFYTVWDYSAFPKEGQFMSPTLSFGKLKAGM